MQSLYILFLGSFWSFLGSCASFELKFLLGNDTLDPLDFLIPTVHSDNDKCRNHSLLYQKELSKFTVWATDMFDASTKFPSGIFIGSIYDTGNFDECVKVHLPDAIGFSGQHCMAHFKLEPLRSVPVTKGNVLEFDKYENIFNISTWHKIAKYAQDGSKQTRDEVYFSFCTPSSCSAEDLERSLNITINKIKTVLPFSLKANVNRRNCQVERKFDFSREDLIFMCVVGAFILIGTLCTVYHLVTKLEEMKQYKLSDENHDILKTFSFSQTIRKMASISKNEDGVDCIHGMKVLSMFGIIMGHRVMFYISSPLSNPVFVEEVYRRLEWVILLNGPIIVDTFFTVSGFLACYFMLLEIDKRKQMINVPILYLHRFLRLTPAYAVVLFFYSTIFVQLGDGPFWQERIGVEQERCLTSWWTNLLYINNYVNVDSIVSVWELQDFLYVTFYSCMFQSWYLTCDTQFFFFVPLLAYILWKKPILGLFSFGILILLSVLVPFIIIFLNEEEPFLLLYMKFLRDPVKSHTFKSIYIPSHMRASSYLIGILAGYCKFHMRRLQIKITQKMMYSGWIISVFVVAVLYLTSFLFYVPTESKDYLFAGIYGSMHHLLWSICIAWCIIAVSEGYGTWVYPIFTWKPLILLSRVTYTSFLCHGAIQLYSAATTRAPIHTGLFNIASFSASDIVLSYIVGFTLSVTFEAPIIAIEKIIFKKKVQESNEHNKGPDTWKTNGLQGMDFKNKTNLEQSSSRKNTHDI